MEKGKIPENLLRQAVLSNLGLNRKEVILGAGIGEDCAAIRLGEDEIFVVSTDPITGTTKDIGKLSVIVTLNDLASSGAEPIGILVTLLLPESSNADTLSEIMEQISRACEDANAMILGGHTEVSSAVNCPIVSVTGVGKAKKDRLITSADAKPGMDLVVTKWIGLEGSSILAKEKYHELISVLPKDLVDAAASFDEHLSVSEDGLLSAPYAAAMHDVTEGGIFGALWELAEASGVGLEVELSNIPIKQETVEICEHFGINPYKLISSGCMLIATGNSKELIKVLSQANIPAAVIGNTTNKKDRIVNYDGSVQYLTPPSPDELYRAL